MFRVGRRAYNENRERRRESPEWLIDNPRLFRIQSGNFLVRYNTNHFDGRRVGAKNKTFADGILARKHLIGEGFINHRNIGCSVVVVEITSLQQRDTDCLKIVDANDAKICFCLFTGGWLWFAVNEETRRIATSQ